MLRRFGSEFSRTRLPSLFVPVALIVLYPDHRMYTHTLAIENAFPVHKVVVIPVPFEVTRDEIVAAFYFTFPLCVDAVANLMAPV